MSQFQNVLEEIRDELSTDIYYIYKDKRHFLLEAIAAAVAMACLIEYFKGLLGPKEIGEAHRQYVKEFVDLVRNDKIISIKAEMDVLEQEAIELGTVACSNLTDENEKAAIQQLEVALKQIGMPSVQAETHSKNIAALVKEHFNG